MDKWYRRDQAIAANELAIREDTPRCSQLIQERLDFDVPWLGDGLADILQHGGSPEALGRFFRAAEKHLEPIITAEAACVLERQEDDS